MIDKGLLKGSIKTIVLKLLSEHQRMYGYEICQHVKTISQEQVILTEGALYPMLHKMEADGLLLTEKVRVGNRVRKYYQLSTTGTQEVTKKLEQFRTYVEAMQLILQPKMTN